MHNFIKQKINMEIMEFHDWLTETVRDKNMTRGEVARAAGIPKAYIDAVFLGKVEPLNFHLKKLSKVLGVDIDYMEDIISGDHVQNLDPVSKHSKYNPETPIVIQLKKNNKTPLQPILDKTCVLTGKPNPERCHYTGIMQHLFGKGVSEKVDNLFIAEICHEKHVEFDQPKEKKSVEASHDFLVAILLTIKRKIENGQIIFKK